MEVILETLMVKVSCFFLVDKDACEPEQSNVHTNGYVGNWNMSWI